jgi:hypothetical protein
MRKGEHVGMKVGKCEGMGAWRIGTLIGVGEDGLPRWVKRSSVSLVELKEEEKSEIRIPVGVGDLLVEAGVRFPPPRVSLAPAFGWTRKRREKEEEEEEEEEKS